MGTALVPSWVRSEAALFCRVGNGPLDTRLADGNTLGYATGAPGGVMRDGVVGLRATSDLVDTGERRRKGGDGNAPSGRLDGAVSDPSESELLLASNFRAISSSQLTA